MNKTQHQLQTTCSQNLPSPTGWAYGESILGKVAVSQVLNSSCWCARALSPPRRVALSLEEREVVGGDRGGKLLAINSKYEWELCFEWANLISTVQRRTQAHGVLHLLSSLVLVSFTVPGTNVPCFFRIPALVQCCK